MGLSQDTLSIGAIRGLHRVPLHLVCIHKLETRVGEENLEDKHIRTRIPPFFPRSWWFRVAACHGDSSCDESIGPILTECLCQYDRDHVVVKQGVRAEKESKGMACHRTHLKQSSPNHVGDVKWGIDFLLHHHKSLHYLPMPSIVGDTEARPRGSPPPPPHQH